MNLKTTLVLFGVLAVALGVLALTQLLGVGRAGDQSDYLFPEIHKKGKTVEAKDIDTVKIEHAAPSQQGTFVFTRKDDGTWDMQQPASYRVDRFQVDSLVSQVLDARREKSETTSDLKETGLDQPSFVVTLKKGDQEWKLNVGKQLQGGDQVVYVSTGKKPKEPAVVRRNDLANVFKNLNEFRSKELLNASALNTQAIELQVPQKPAVSLDKGSDGRWTFLKPAGWGRADYEGVPPPMPAGPGAPPPAPTSPAGVRDLLTAVDRLRVETDADFVANDVGEKELKEKYGLDKDAPTTLRIEVKTKGRLTDLEDKAAVTQTLLIGNKVPEEKKPEEKKDEKKDDKKLPEPPKTEYYYARLAGENHVVKVPAKLVEPVLQVANNPDPLRDRDLVSVDKDKVDAVQIQNASGTLKLFHAELLEPWKLWRTTGQEADANAVRQLLDALTAKRRVEGFPAIKPAEAGMDAKDRLAVVELWVGGLKKQEKKDAEPQLNDPKKPTVRLTFGKQDKDKGTVYVLREVDGEKEPTLLLVKDRDPGKETLVDKVTGNALAYLDRRIPSFVEGPDTEVKQLILTRGGETFDLKKEKTGAETLWKFAAPKELAGRTADYNAVHNVLDALKFLSSTRLIAEKADEKGLEGYGLTPKTAQVEATVVLVGKDNKEEKHVYLFGKENADKTGLYFKTGSSDLVHLVPTTVLQALQGELQDLTVYRFDPTKVKSAKMVGWRKLLGTAYTLELERKGKDDWLAKQPKDFNLDAAKIENFIESLSRLRAMKFVAKKGGPKPEHKLDAKDNPELLEIELSIDGEKDPYKLTIGAANTMERGYYAVTNKLDGYVLLLPEDPFKAVLEKPGYFSK